jgi:hypothetical protein
MHTMNGGILVLPNIHLHGEFSPRKVKFWKATETTKPSIMPKAVPVSKVSRCLEIPDKIPN